MIAHDIYTKYTQAKELYTEGKLSERQWSIFCEEVLHVLMTAHKDAIEGTLNEVQIASIHNVVENLFYDERLTLSVVRDAMMQICSIAEDEGEEYGSGGVGAVSEYAREDVFDTLIDLIEKRPKAESKNTESSVITAAVEDIVKIIEWKPQSR